MSRTAENNAMLKRSRSQNASHKNASIFDLRYDMPVKRKPQSEEYTRFENLLGDVLSVSKEEITRRIEEDKREKKKPKSSSRVSAERSSPS